jgi:hypothetical protein
VQPRDDAGARRLRTVFFLMVYKVTVTSLSRPFDSLDFSTRLREQIQMS